ncbi:MAG: T9SS type A sorting domain-containing protein [Bacteroidota bacterium]
MSALTRKVILFLACLSFAISVKAQCTAITELVFSNPSLVPGSSDIYRFSHINSNADAIVSIHSSFNASLEYIDDTRDGVSNAFQPTINILSQNPSGTEAYIDFQIDFVHTGTETPIDMDPFVLSAVDVDGDNYRLRESVGLGDFSSFTLDGLYSVLNYSSNTAMNMTSFETSNYNQLSGIATHSTSNSVLFDYNGGSSIIVRARIIDDGDVLPSKSDQRLFSFNFDPCLINCYSNPLTLPVEYNFFSAQKVEDMVELKWETGLEINNDRFEIERSFDGENFQQIGVVVGYGNSDETQAYQFIDPNPVFGKILYRLKQIDFDGAFNYSTSQEVFYSVEKDLVQMKVYPNPATDYLHISSNGDLSDSFIKIFNQQGQLVMLENMGSGINVLDIRNLPAGVYHLDLQSSHFYLPTRKIVIR